MTSRRILAYGFLVTVAVALTAASAAPLFSSIDLRLYDTMLRSAGTRPTSGRIALVAVDDRSLAQVGQWPWSRDVVARLVEGLRQRGAKVIALDLLLAEPDRFGPRTRPEEPAGTDVTLADALSKGHAIVAYALTFGAESGDRPPCVLHPLDVVLTQRGERRSAGEQLFHASGVTCSLPALARSAGASGYVNAAPDRDGLLRRIPLLMAFEGNIYPSLALAAVRQLNGIRHLALSPLAGERATLVLDGRQVPLDERGTLLIRFRGKRGSFPQVSASDVLNGRVPADTLKDRIVFVGATALGTGDVVATPFDTSVPGIEVHAAAADTLLQGDFISTPSYTRAYELLGTVAFGMTAATLVAVAGFVYGSAFSLVLAGVLWWATSIGVASAGIFLSPLFPSLAVIGTLAILTLRKVRHERRRAESERGRRERANRFAVHSLTSLVGTRDLATGKHARRTQEYARLLATQLAAQPRFRASLTPEYVDLIARLAPLHDIGKVGVRDAVLHKPGPLSAEEFDEMRRHPSFGYDTLLNAERLAGEAGGTTKRSCASRKRSSTRTTNVGTAKDILGASRVRRSRSAGASWPW
jgi:adenylate cyclase